jgi:hypothetical protein
MAEDELGDAARQHAVTDCLAPTGDLELEDDIRTWINEWHKDSGQFVWAKSADDILETVAEYCQRITGPGCSCRE